MFIRLHKSQSVISDVNHKFLLEHVPRPNVTYRCSHQVMLFCWFKSRRMVTSVSYDFFIVRKEFKFFKCFQCSSNCCRRESSQISKIFHKFFHTHDKSWRYPLDLVIEFDAEISESVLIRIRFWPKQWADGRQKVSFISITQLNWKMLIIWKELRN